MDRRDELTSQLSQATGERMSLTNQLRLSPTTDGASIRSRIHLLDARIERLQAEVDRTNDLIMNTSPDVLTALRGENREATAPPMLAGRPLASVVVPLAGMFTVFFLFPIAIAIARLLWKRASAPTRPALPDAASAQRLDQLQQSVDAIALEVERISEGQRYVAKLFSEKERPAIGA
jgi:hypothetical protein